MSHKILAVDDHPETLDIVVITLKQYGYNVVSTTSAKEGLKLAESERPDLILLDVNMPEMDGLEVCRRLRANADLSSTPIIMFTAEDEAYQKLAGFDAGADDYLTKPTDPDEMIARIEGILGIMEDEAEVEGEEDAGESSPSIDYLLEKTIVIPESKAQKMAEAAPVKGSLVAVVGARSGTGTTLTAVNLAATFARLETTTTLIDFDTIQGHVSLYLNQKVKGSINTLADLPEDNIPAWLPKQIFPVSPHLQFLFAQPNQDGRFSHPNSYQTDAILSTLLKSGQTIVADIGHTLSETQRRVLEQADRVIVVLSPERVALAAAKRLLHHLQEVISPDAMMSAVIFDVNGRMNLPQKAVETYLEHPIHAVIPITLEELTQTANKGTILVSSYPESKTAQRFYQLARQLIATK
ncbi:MAG: response regulator [Ardenticatenaceae bacterium]|nr:response regulator [Ardenticatenaceae bacterium]